jgi:hypothetical protein
MPCCILALLVFFGPRLVLLGIWIFNNPYMSVAVNSFLLQCLGFLFLPWTLLAYIFAFHFAPGAAFLGLDTVGLLIVVAGFVLDIMSYSGSGWGNRERIRGYYRA